MFFDRAMCVLQPLPPSTPRLTISPQARNGQRNPPPPPSAPSHPPNQPLHPQILFLIGLPLIIGPYKTVLFFARRQKWQGTLAFVSGILIILLRWPLVGFLVELYGIFVLFGDFLITIGGYAGNVPVVGPWIRRAMEVLAGERRNSELPV